MELRHLRYFRAVAEELHFGRAAARLHIAQPPLSQQIRQLEAELGVTLLNRSTRRVELTPAGADYLEQVVAILDSVDAAGQRAQRIGHGRQGHLSVGCVGSATYSLLPRLVLALSEQLPEIDVTVRGEMLVPDQLAALDRGDIDLALLRPPPVPSGLPYRRLRSDRLIAALPAGHRLAQAAGVEVPVTRLRDEPFITHVGGGRSVMHEVLLGLCAQAGFTPRIRHDVEETSTLVTLVAAGLGVAVVPEPTAALGIPGVSYHPLREVTDEIELGVGLPPGGETPLLTRVLAVLRTLADAA